MGRNWNRNHVRVGLLSASFFLLCFYALKAFVAEYQAVLTLTGSTKDLIEQLADAKGDLPQPGSARSTRDTLSACGRALTVVPILKADEGLAAQVRSRCGAIAGMILTLSPSNSRARAVDLLTAERVDAERLRLAQAAAPFEPWPLNIRLQALARMEPPSAEVAVLMEDDLQRALMSRWGREVVVNLYLSREDLRPLIIQAAEKLSGDDQRDFVELLRRMSRGVR